MNKTEVTEEFIEKWCRKFFSYHTHGDKEKWRNILIQFQRMLTEAGVSVTTKSGKGLLKMKQIDETYINEKARQLHEASWTKPRKNEGWAIGIKEARSFIGFIVSEVLGGKDGKNQSQRIL